MAPRPVFRRRRNGCQVSVVRRRQLISFQHLLQIACQPDASEGVQTKTITWPETNWTCDWFKRYGREVNTRSCSQITTWTSEVQHLVQVCTVKIHGIIKFYASKCLFKLLYRTSDYLTLMCILPVALLKYLPSYQLFRPLTHHPSIHFTYLAT